MKKNLLLALLCTFGAALALPAVAADRGWHYDRHDHRAERSHQRYVGHDRRSDRRESYRERRDSRVRYVLRGRYCDDRSHLRTAHYHVAPRDYYAYGYPRDAYRLHRSSGLDATLIVTLPLF